MIPKSLVALLALAIFAACDSHNKRVQADSTLAAAERQQKTLGAQRDSLTRLIEQGDAMFFRIDSSIKTVKGLPVRRRVTRELESPLEEQMARRTELLERVDALVKRAKATTAELAETRKKVQELTGENDQLKRLSDQDQQVIASLTERVQERTATIADLEARLDSLVAETRVIAERYYRAYYIVGTERELIRKGVIERDGGANLLVARVGRSLTPARRLPTSLFTVIDQREVRLIPVPDTTKRYAIVSRQDLDGAKVAERYRSTFRGPLRIADVDSFWEASRFLILVER